MDTLLIRLWRVGSCLKEAWLRQTGVTLKYVKTVHTLGWRGHWLVEGECTGFPGPFSRQHITQQCRYWPAVPWGCPVGPVLGNHRVKRCHFFFLQCTPLETLLNTIVHDKNAPSQHFPNLSTNRSKAEERPPVQRLGTCTLGSKSSGSVTFYQCGPGTSLSSLSPCFFTCKMGLWEGTKWDMDAKLITPCLVHYALKDHYYSFYYIHIHWTVTVWMYNSISLM